MIREEDGTLRWINELARGLRVSVQQTLHQYCLLLRRLEKITESHLQIKCEISREHLYRFLPLSNHPLALTCLRGLTRHLLQKGIERGIRGHLGAGLVGKKSTFPGHHLEAPPSGQTPASPQPNQSSVARSPGLQGCRKGCSKSPSRRTLRSPASPQGSEPCVCGRLG